MSQRSPGTLPELVALADRLRDAREFDAAAERYAEALALAPARTDLRVQLGNMLKDAGRLVEAEAAYRQALLEEPGNADTHLQLGHVLKVGGDRAAAIVAYENALLADPHSDSAWRELTNLGVSRHDEVYTTSWEARGGREAPLELTASLAGVERVLQELKMQLPVLTTRSAFPIAAYASYRANNAVLTPPRKEGRSATRFLIVSNTTGVGSARLERQIRSVIVQTHRAFRYVGLGTGDVERSIVARFNISDKRIEGNDGEDATAPQAMLLRPFSEEAILLLESGRELHPDALAWFEYGLEHCDAWIADEEEMVGHRLIPHLRRLVDPHTLRESNPYGETIVLSRNAFSPQVLLGAATARVHLLHLLGQGSIGHIPLPLIRNVADVGADLASPVPSVATPPMFGPIIPTTVIIPTRDNVSDVLRFVASLQERARRPAELRFIIVDNGSRQPTDRAQLSKLALLPNHSVLQLPGVFNWSYLNNMAARAAPDGNFVFANDDMMMLSNDWDLVLGELLGRQGVGAVGAKLVYPDETVQHAGILMGWRGGTIHDGLHADPTHGGPADRWRTTHAVSAVTGAFLATRSSLFSQFGGFDETLLSISYNDIDYALRLRARDLAVLWTPHIVLEHHESKSRGLDHLTEEKFSRAAAELRTMRQRWGRAMDEEPSVPPYFLDASRPLRLLRAPGQSAVEAYMRRTAAKNPWKVAPEPPISYEDFPP